MKLRDMLDKKGVSSDSLIIVIKGNTTMSVSRRYLSCTVWRDILDAEVIMNDRNVYIIE